MVGGGNRKDDLVISNSNVFAALGTLKKKKKNSDKDSRSKTASSSSTSKAEKKPDSQVFWAPAPLTVKSWADVDDEDDDDYYATTAPPQSVWSPAPVTAEQHSKPKESTVHLEVCECRVNPFSSIIYNVHLVYCC